MKKYLVLRLIVLGFFLLIVLTLCLGTNQKELANVENTSPAPEVNQTKSFGFSEGELDFGLKDHVICCGPPTEEKEKYTPGTAFTVMTSQGCTSVIFNDD